MSRSFLVTRPEHDNTTNYLSKWCEKTIKFASSRNIKVFDLVKERAVKEEVVSFLLKKDPEFVVFNGHGNDDIISGHKNLFLIKAGENEGLLKNKIVYAISCRSARILGVKSIEKGAKAYLGYNDDFIFVFDKNKISNPLKDEIAENFFEPSNELIETLLKGNITKEAFNRAQKMFKDNIGKYLNSESLGSTHIAKYLWWDLRNLVLLGDEKASFS